MGLFTASCLERWPGATIVAVEPDPENLQLLERMAAEEERIEVEIGACAGAGDGSVRFLARLFAESPVVEDGHEGETLELPCVDAFRLAESADLVKMTSREASGIFWPTSAWLILEWPPW